MRSPVPGDHIEQRPGHIRPEPMHVMTHRGQGRPSEPQSCESSQANNDTSSGTRTPISAATDNPATAMMSLS